MFRFNIPVVGATRVSNLDVNRSDKKRRLYPKPAVLINPHPRRNGSKTRLSPQIPSKEVRIVHVSACIADALRSLQKSKKWVIKKVQATATFQKSSERGQTIIEKTPCAHVLHGGRKHPQVENFSLTISCACSLFFLHIRSTVVRNFTLLSRQAVPVFLISKRSAFSVLSQARRPRPSPRRTNGQLRGRTANRSLPRRGFGNAMEGPHPKCWNRSSSGARQRCHPTPAESST